MELKDIVCDAKYAKQLKELGVLQTSFACFSVIKRDGKGEMYRKHPILSENKKEGNEYYSTFTVEELLKILPPDISHNKSYDGASYYLVMCYDGEHNYPMAFYEDDDLTEDEVLVSESDKTKMSNALAKVLIHLIKMKKLAFKEAKKSKSKPLKVKEIPTERVVYKKVGKYYYSFKFKCWVEKTKVVLDGNWYTCNLIKQDTGEIIDEILGVTQSNLNNRLLDYVNNPNVF